MKISYLKFYQENLEKVEGKYAIPFDENIMDVLKSTGKKYPKAYQEFMYLAIGLPGIYDSGIDSGIKYAIGRQQMVERLLKKYNFQIEGDYWVICELHSGEYFDFFLFNDPKAEDQENPPVYSFSIQDMEEGALVTRENNIEKSHDFFSDYIEDEIRLKLGSALKKEE